MIGGNLGSLLYGDVSVMVKGTNGYMSEIHLLRNDKAYNLETCKAALGIWTHYRSLYKRWPWADLDLFYGKVKLGLL